MIKLNLASHGDNKVGFINIDFNHPSADLKADVTALPFEDNSVDLIYAFHILEHMRAGHYEPELSNPLNPRTALEAVVEWRRVLKPGGRLEIKVPDFDKIVWLYENFPSWAAAPSPVLAPFCNFSDWIVSNGQHQCLFNKSSMYMLLLEAGFDGVDFLDGDPQRAVDRANLEMHVVCEK